MSMTKRQIENKDKIVSMMCSTAEHNGKAYTRIGMIRLADRLHRLEATLQRLAVAECESESYDEAKQERIEKLAESLVTKEIGCKAYTQRDPRGYAIRMYLVDWDGKPWSNTWDGETTGLNW